MRQKKTGNGGRNVSRGKKEKGRWGGKKRMSPRSSVSPLGLPDETSNNLRKRARLLGREGGGGGSKRVHLLALGPGPRKLAEKERRKKNVFRRKNPRKKEKIFTWR